MPSSAVLLLLCLMAFTYAQTDPCGKGNHVELDEPNRSTAIRLKPGSSGDTDAFLKKGWYRFVSGAGGEIPTKPPQAGQCNTKKPIWLKGKQPPMDGNIHTLTMCLSGYGPCGVSLPIRAKRCIVGVIYELVPTKIASSTQNISDASYCAGREKLCPPGQTSITGFTPNCYTTTTLPSTSFRSTSATSATLPVTTTSSKTHRVTTTSSKTHRVTTPSSATLPVTTTSSKTHRVTTTSSKTHRVTTTSSKTHRVTTTSSKTHHVTTPSSATLPDMTPSGSSANRNSLAVIGFVLLLIVNFLCQN